jgi:hypothetical protein
MQLFDAYGLTLYTYGRSDGRVFRVKRGVKQLFIKISQSMRKILAFCQVIFPAPLN